MNKLKTFLELLRYSRVEGWPSLIRYFLCRALHLDVRVDLKLGDFRWVAMTTKPSGLHFFTEVIVHESYSRIRDDLQNLKAPLILDAGANCGAFALWALSVNPQARVISFEPGECFTNLAINQQFFDRTSPGRWQIEKCALSSTVGTGSFTQLENSSMGALSQDGPDLIPIRTIDDLGFSPQVLKLDVEGHEVEVLKGSEKALATAKVVVLEYHTEELGRQCRDFLLAHHFALEEKNWLIVGRK